MTSVTSVTQDLSQRGALVTLFSSVASKVLEDPTRRSSSHFSLWGETVDVCQGRSRGLPEWSRSLGETCLKWWCRNKKRSYSFGIRRRTPS